MEITGLNKQQYKAMRSINGSINRGEMPSAQELRAAGAEAHFALIPPALLASVVRKNAATFETRSRVARSSARPRVRYTQDQIDEMVDNRDLTKYPLSRSEELDIEARQRRLNAIQAIL